MKLRRKKLVALAMSALMVASVMPVASFAEDESAVYFEEVADETPVGEDSEYFIAEEDYDYDEIIAEADEDAFVADDAEYYDDVIAEADDSDFVVDEQDEEELVGDDSNAYTPDPESIVFYFGDDEKEDLLVEYKLKKEGGSDYLVDADGNVVIKTAKAEIYKDQGAACKRTVGLKVELPELPGKTFYSKDFVIEDESKHVWTVKETNINSYPTCDEPGDGEEVRACSKCGKEETVSIKDKLEKLGHKWGETKSVNIAGENVKADENGNAVFGSDGKAELIEETKDGSYFAVFYQICERDKTHVRYVDKDGKEVAVDKEATYDENGNLDVDEGNGEEIIVLAKKESYAKVTSQKGIVTDLIDMDPADVPADEDIELENCTKDGSYVIQYFNENDRPIAQTTKVVKAHHKLQTVIEFKSQTDKNQCNVKQNKDGSWTVTNKNCSRDIPYYEVQICTASGTCNLKKCSAKGYVHNHAADAREYKRDAKTAERSTQHIINTDITERIEDLKDDKGLIRYEDLEDLAYGTSKKTTDIEKAKEVGSYIVISSNTATCEEAGVVTVDYICKICGTKVESKEYKTAALGHKAKAPERKVIKEASCTEEGLYDATIYCERCGKALREERNVKIPMVPHKYSKTPAIVFDGKVVVDFNGSLKKGAKDLDVVGLMADEHGAYEDFCVTADLYDVCTVCGHKEEAIGDTSLEIVDIDPSEYSCVSGSITIKATGKDEDGKAVSPVTATFPYYKSINAYQGRTKHDPGEPDENGQVVCKICGQVIKEGTPSDETHEHKAGEAAIENYVAPSCGVAGSYDLVTKCTECGEVISSIHVDTDALKHNFSAWSMYQKRSVFQIGKYERTCSICGKRQTKSMPKYTSVCALNRQTITIKVGQKVSVRVTKHHPGDTIGSVSSTNNAIAKGFKADSYIAKIVGKGVGTATFTVKMKAGATASVKVIVKKK